MARNCSRRMCSRCELLIVFWTSSWILVRSCATSTSRREQRDELAQARDRVGLLQEGDAIVESEIGTRAGDVGDQLGLGGAGHRDRGIGADLSARVDVFGEERADRPEERVHLGAFDGLDRDRRDRRDPGVTRGVEGIDAHALLAFYERVGAAARQPPECADMGDDGDRMHVVDRGFVTLGIALDRQDYTPVSVHGSLEGGDRTRPAGGERRKLRRKDDIVPERDRRERHRSGSGSGRSGVGGPRWLDVGHPNRIAGPFRRQTSIRSPVSQSRRQAAA